MQSLRIGARMGLTALLLLAACTDGPGVSVVTTTAAASDGTADAPTTAGGVGAGTIVTAPVASEPVAVTTTATATTPSGLPLLDAAAAADLIATFDTTDLYGFSILSAHRSDPAVVAVARQTLDGGAAGPSEWAAAYVWVNEGDDAGPLIALAASADPATRVMAATGLLARGRIEGFAPLVALLVDDTPTPGWPPSSAWQDATTALARFTAISENGPPFDASPTQRENAAAKWQAWLDAHQATLTFDPEVALWTVG